MRRDAGCCEKLRAGLLEDFLTEKIHVLWEYFMSVAVHAAQHSEFLSCVLNSLFDE